MSTPPKIENAPKYAALRLAWEAHLLCKDMEKKAWSKAVVGAMATDAIRRHIRFILRMGNGLPWSSVLSRRNVRKPVRS